jgi:hypothetical protein
MLGQSVIQSRLRDTASILGCRDHHPSMVKASETVNPRENGDGLNRKFSGRRKGKGHLEKKQRKIAGELSGYFDRRTKFLCVLKGTPTVSVASRPVQSRPTISSIPVGISPIQ